MHVRIILLPSSQVCTHYSFLYCKWCKDGLGATNKASDQCDMAPRRGMLRCETRDMFSSSHLERIFHYWNGASFLRMAYWLERQHLPLLSVLLVTSLQTMYLELIMQMPMPFFYLIDLQLVNLWQNTLSSGDEEGGVHVEGFQHWGCFIYVNLAVHELCSLLFSVTP